MDSNKAVMACVGYMSRLANVGEHSRAPGRPDPEYQLHVGLADEKDSLPSGYVCAVNACRDVISVTGR